MRDTIVAKIGIEADYSTLQSLRQALEDEVVVTQFQDYLLRAVAHSLEQVIDESVVLDIDLDTPSYHWVKKGARDPTPQVENGVLTWYDAYEERTNTVGKVGSQAWFAWLAAPRNTSFGYTSKDQANFTGIKDKRGIWRAHKLLAGKLRRKYLGKAANLTEERMDEVALELAHREPS